MTTNMPEIDAPSDILIVFTSAGPFLEPGLFIYDMFLHMRGGARISYFNNIDKSYRDTSRTKNAKSIQLCTRVNPRKHHTKRCQRHLEAQLVFLSHPWTPFWLRFAVFFQSECPRGARVHGFGTINSFNKRKTVDTSLPMPF